MTVGKANTRCLFININSNEERKQDSKSQENNPQEWLHKLKHICTVDHVMELVKIMKHNCTPCHRKYLWYKCILS